MKFYVGVVEHRSKVVEVEAGGYEEALTKAEAAYYDDVILLDMNDIDDGTEFFDETDLWTPCIETGYKVRFQRIE